MEKLGFIGLGIMGRPMAKNLLKAGHRLVVYDIVQAPVEDLAAAGAEKALTAREVAEQCPVVITMLPDSPDVENVVLSSDGLLEAMGPGSLLVDMSSISPITSKEISAKLAEKGAAMLDAPVSGGEPKAVDGTLSIMAGGPAESFERVRPILSAMGKAVVHVGAIGSGNTVKLTNQIIVALNIAAMSEGLVLAAKSGVDPEVAWQAIRGGLAGSTVLDAKVPLALDGNFKPGFRIELHIKDLKNALAAAHEAGVPVPLTSQVMEIMQALKADGKAKDDHGGIIQFYEKLAHSTVRRRKG